MSEAVIQKLLAKLLPKLFTRIPRAAHFAWATNTGELMVLSGCPRPKGLRCKDVPPRSPGFPCARGAPRTAHSGFGCSTAPWRVGERGVGERAGRGCRRLPGRGPGGEVRGGERAARMGLVELEERSTGWLGVRFSAARVSGLCRQAQWFSAATQGGAATEAAADTAGRQGIPSAPCIQGNARYQAPVSSALGSRNSPHCLHTCMPDPK